MSFNINEYKLKHIVSINKELLEDISIIVEIDNENYNFKVENVGSEIIEFVDYFKYGEINNSLSTLEQKLKDYTYGKTFNEFSKQELYDIRFSKFKVPINGDEHEFEISGAGPTALKVSLYIRFDKIETLDNEFEKQLKEDILNIYTPLIEKNKNYQKKIIEMKEQYDAEQARLEKIREENRKEEEEKERKRRELEEMLNSNKPKNKPFKMY